MSWLDFLPKKLSKEQWREAVCTDYTLDELARIIEAQGHEAPIQGEGQFRCGGLSNLCGEYAPDLVRVPPISATRNFGRDVPDKEVDDEMLSYVASGALVPYNLLEWGWPPVISPIFKIVGTSRTRVVVDFRGLNESIRKEPMALPSAKEICVEMGAGDVIAKTDLKSGYHQLRADKRAWFLLAIVWRKKLWAFTVPQFGLRDAPRRFQAATSMLARRISVPEAISRFVYLDDFIFRIVSGAGPSQDLLQRIIQQLSARGAVVSEKKCVIGTRVLILGVGVDTAAGCVFVPEEKRQWLIQRTRATLEGRAHPSAKSIAQLIGRWVAVRDAWPWALALLRPLSEAMWEVLPAKDKYRWEEALEFPPLMKQYWHRFASVTVVPLSEVTRDGLSLALQLAHENHVRTLPRFVDPRRKIIIESDASDGGVGGRAVWADDNDQITAYSIPLPESLRGASSHRREAYGIGEITCHLKWERIAAGKRLFTVIRMDNMSMLSSWTKGTRDEIAARIIIESIRLILRFGELNETRYIPSRLNVSDRYSRDCSAAEIEVRRETAERIAGGSFGVDLMSSLERKHPPIAKTSLSWRENDFFIWFPNKEEARGAWWLFPPPSLTREAIAHLGTLLKFASPPKVVVITRGVHFENYENLLKNSCPTRPVTIISRDVRVEYPPGFAAPQSWKFWAFAM